MQFFANHPFKPGLNQKPTFETRAQPSRHAENAP